MLQGVVSESLNWPTVRFIKPSRFDHSLVQMSMMERCNAGATGQSGWKTLHVFILSGGHLNDKEIVKRAENKARRQTKTMCAFKSCLYKLCLQTTNGLLLSFGHKEAESDIYPVLFRRRNKTPLFVCSTES